MKNNKVYFPKDALARREDFDMWYEDGGLFLRFEGDWAQEKNKIAVIGRMGGEVGCIKPDHKTMNYYLRSERWEYCLHTHVIFKHYYVEGMIWDLHGSMANPPFDFTVETRSSDAVKDVHVKLVDFRDKGECYEIKVKDLSKLRIAAIAAVAIARKEDCLGLSEGEELTKATPRLERLRNRISTRPRPFEEMVARYPEIEDVAAMRPR